MQDAEDRIIKVDIEHEMRKSYIDYSMSVIVARALPDVRDGFKPVHRRILYGMKEAGISKGLLFHYFINKQGLYSFLMDYSVKYLLFEYDRAVGDMTDFFEYHIRIEGAKTGVLRNYPYMYGFIERSKKETDPDIRAISKDALALSPKYLDLQLVVAGRSCQLHICRSTYHQNN